MHIDTEIELTVAGEDVLLEFTSEGYEDGIALARRFNWDARTWSPFDDDALTEEQRALVEERLRSAWIDRDHEAGECAREDRDNRRIDQARGK